MKPSLALEPTNVEITPQGKVEVLDFGGSDIGDREVDVVLHRAQELGGRAR